MTIQQISIFLENKSGQLAEIISILAKNNIDIRAIHLAETTDYAVLRLITTKPQDATSILLGEGFILSMTPVVAVAVPDEPGGLARLLDIFAKAEFDIEYMYSVFGKNEGTAYMIFRVTDTDDLEKILNKNGISSVNGKELGVD